MRPGTKIRIIRLQDILLTMNAYRHSVGKTYVLTGVTIGNSYYKTECGREFHTYEFVVLNNVRNKPDRGSDV